MATILGTNSIVHLFTNAGSTDISGDLNTISMNFNRDNPEVTTFGDLTVQRIAGIRDYSFDFAGIYNTGASNVHSIAITDMNGSLYSLLKFAPGGSVTGCPVYSGCVLLTTIGITNPHNGPGAVNFSCQAGTGSLTAACVA